MLTYKDFLRQWIIVNMNDAQQDLETTTLRNYTLEELYDDMCEVVDDFQEYLEEGEQC